MRGSGSCRNLLFALCLLVVIASVNNSLSAADPKSTQPANVSDAAQTIDLRKLTRLTESDIPQQAQLTQLSYPASGNVKSAYEFHRQQLTKAGWKEFPQSQVADTYASATFGKNAFTVSLTVTDAGVGGKVSVTLINHGNVNLNQLPLPANTQPLYAGPVSAMFTSSTSVEDAMKELQTALGKRGWTPYGQAGNQYFFRQNAVRLSLSVSSAPAQGGKTMIVYSAEQLSAELPAPVDVSGLQYSDATHQLLFDTPSSEEQIFQYYREALASSKWKATLEKPLKIGFRDTVIFRNPEMDLIEMQMHTVDDKRRVQLTWKSAVEVAEEERRAKEAIDSKKMKQATPAVKIPLALPAAAQGVDITASRIEFKLATGTAKRVIASLQAELEKSGWKLNSKATEVQEQFGILTLEKREQQLTINYVDPGFIPAEVSISAAGGELEVKSSRRGD